MLLHVYYTQRQRQWVNKRQRLKRGAFGAMNVVIHHFIEVQ